MPVRSVAASDVQAKHVPQEREASVRGQEASTSGQHIAASGSPPPARSASVPAVQPKLTMGAAGDRFEQEADTVADRVVQRMESGNVGGYHPPSVQAKCTACQEEDETLRRQAEPGDEDEMLRAKAEGPPAAVPDSVRQGLESGHATGEALNPPLQLSMEEAFQRDFSGVRIHTGNSAESLNRDLNARAFTHGRDIYFNTGEFRPETRGGRHLLAHELTHVVQQSGADGLDGGDGNDGAPATIQRDEAGGGSTEFRDQVTTQVRPTHGPGVIEGTVTRIETAPATGSQPRQEIHRGEINLRFDPSDCSITIPFGYRFVQAAQATGTGICDDPPPTTAVPLLANDAFNRLKAGVVEAVNRGLNGWFDVRLSGGACPGGCADRPLPIRVAAREDTANPNATITVVNRGGRADAATICAASWDRETAVHEGGHQVLGVGDEYPEEDQRLRATRPQWFRRERVRRDYSAMGPEEHSRFAMFHERHFNAVKIFLENAFPGCTATLQARPRPVIPDFRIVLGGGYASLSGTSGTFFEAGLRLGIPLDRLRHWEFVLGPQIDWISAFSDRRHQEALLLGARLGLEGSTGVGGHGLTGGLFGEAGYGWFSSTDYSSGGAGTRSARAGYGEIGLGFGYRTPILGGSSRFDFRIEGAAGTALGAPGIIGPTTPEIESDPQRSRWFRLGVTLGAQF